MIINIMITQRRRPDLVAVRFVDLLPGAETLCDFHRVLRGAYYNDTNILIYLITNIHIYIYVYVYVYV